MWLRETANLDFSAFINGDIFSQDKCFCDMLISDKNHKKCHQLKLFIGGEKKEKFLDKTVTGILLDAAAGQELARQIT